MSLRPQRPSTAPKKQGWQSWLLADPLHYGPDAVQEAGNGQDIKQGFPASACVVRDLEEAEVAKSAESRAFPKVTSTDYFCFGKWRTGRVPVGADRNPTLAAFFYVRPMR